MAVIRAVLFDWRGTLAVNLSDAEIVRQAFRRLGRAEDDAEVQKVVRALDEAATGPSLRAAFEQIDCDASFHRATYARLFAAAGLDDALSEELYSVESDPAYNPFADDAVPTLEALHQRGLKVAVVSDIHFDLRPVFRQAGLAGLVSSFVLSYERGVQKPDPAIFAMALEDLQIMPVETMMVGDRAAYDGAALSLGIPTLLLPPLQHVRHRRLDLVLRLTAEKQES